MKLFWIPVFLLFALSSQAQTTTPKLPKLRYETQFLGNKYEIGDKPATAADIGLHLEKNNADAYHHWRLSQSLETQTTVFLLLGTGALVAALLIKNEPAKIGGYVAAGGFGIIGLGTAIGADNRQKKAFETYNRAAGY